jgi:GNAT superfamily N-acetyltransferase
MEGSAPTIRVALPSDAPGLAALMTASAVGLFPAYYDARQTASAVNHVARVDPMLLEDGTYFVLEADGEMVACGGWSRRFRPYTGSGEAAEDDRPLDPATEAGHVRAMFVRPDWTRRGLGRRIIAACERAALDEEFRRLDLVATLPGVPLYEACGFVPDGPVEDIILVDGTRLPCLKMSKVIRPDHDIR